MSDMTTIETCKNCGLSYRASLAFPHECAEWTKGKPTTEPIGPRDNESLSERLTRITAQRNRYWEQVEVLSNLLRELGWHSQNRKDSCWCHVKSELYAEHTKQCKSIQHALAAVAEESEREE